MTSVAPGWTNAKSSSYIPTLYAMKLLIAFYAATVFGAIANTEYEGEITKYGDKVVIRTLPDAVINDYLPGQDIDYQVPSSTPVELNIDKGKYWALALDAAEEKQMDLAYVEKWATHFSEQLRNAIDTDLLAHIYADVSPHNAGATGGAESGSINLGVTGTPLSINSANAIECILRAGQALDEQNVPDEDRWMVLPSWLVMKLKLSDIKDASMTGDGQSVLRNGRIGMIDRFTLYRSNNVAKVTDTTSCWHCPFGHKAGVTFATQITKKEQLKNPKSFGDLLRMLQVYGYEVVKPEAVGDLYCKPTTEPA